MSLRIDVRKAVTLSPYVFGYNLEHTRSAVGGNGGLSAQMLRNRKFAGKPQKNSGIAAEWTGIGDRAFFQTDGRVYYTRHIGCERMHRRNELQSMRVQNLRGGLCGISQGGLTVKKGAMYELRAVTIVSIPVLLTAELTDRSGMTVYARHVIPLIPSDWQTSDFTLTSTADDGEAVVRFVFTEQAEVIFGALSMMPADHFHGMRADVVQLLKEIGPAVIRWPGGNFAGEYRWKDGLLPSDMRGPLEAATEDETQPHSHGYDFHEISTDDFVALCRKVGAEPFLTINLVWNSAQDSADWVEYCNGSTDTEYGRKRAENGFPEPFNVHFWSLGNEMGYGHMEGPMQPDDYAMLAQIHIDAMRSVTPDLALFSSGPYPNDVWAKESAAKLADSVKYISLHHYSEALMDYTTPEKIAETYHAIVATPDFALQNARNMRVSLDHTGEKLHISFDEWNFWYAWYRPSCVGEGIFTAKMLHMLLKESVVLDMPFCCYFQPVGEGAILVEPDAARLTANGQIFSLMKDHRGGSLCELIADEEVNESVLATVKDDILTVTFLNDRYDIPKEFSVQVPGTIERSELLYSDEVIPYTFFSVSPLKVNRDGDEMRFTLPPHSVAKVTLHLPGRTNERY